jgi:hypothetical protein
MRSLRSLVFRAALIALVAIPVLAIAEDPTAWLDPVSLINALPIPGVVKALLIFGWPLLYAAAVGLRGRTDPTSTLGRIVRWVLDGVKHPSERAPAPAPATPAPAPASISSAASGDFGG